LGQYCSYTLLFRRAKFESLPELVAEERPVREELSAHIIQPFWQDQYFYAYFLF
jgi:hypothetical protein